MALIVNWKKHWRSFTVLISVTGIAVTNILACLPNWTDVPPEIKTLIPPEHVPYVSTFFFVAAILTRAIQQPSLHVTDVKSLKQQIKDEIREEDVKNGDE